MSRKEKQKRDTTAVYNEIKLDIPEDEVWAGNPARRIRPVVTDSQEAL